MPAPRITVVGSANTDLVAHCERLPRAGETLTDATLERFPGGKGANQAVAAKRLGADVRFVGKVGADDLVLRSMREAGVDVSGVVRDDGETGTALVLVDGEGENAIVVAPAANRRLRPEEVELGRPDAVMCQLEIPFEVVGAVERQARSVGAFFCLNAAPARGPLPPGVEPDLLIVNRYERERVGDYDGLTALTLGADGAVLAEHGQDVAQARAPKVEALDGTAAGDAFCGALVVSLLLGLERQQALVRACAAGALAATRRGAQPSLPTARELDALLASDPERGEARP